MNTKHRKNKIKKVLLGTIYFTQKLIFLQMMKSYSQNYCLSLLIQRDQTKIQYFIDLLKYIWIIKLLEYNHFKKMHYLNLSVLQIYFMVKEKKKKTSKWY